MRDVNGMPALDWARQRSPYVIVQIIEEHIAKKGNNPTHKIMTNHQRQKTATFQGKNDNKSLGKLLTKITVPNTRAKNQ